MHNHLPGWLGKVLIQERIKVVHDSFLEDTALHKETAHDFELEWQEHGLKKMSKTWGFDAQQRVEQLLIETETSLSDLGKLVVLDAGCGNGLLTEAIAAHGAKVLGIDLINNLLQLTGERKKSENLYYLHADIHHLPLAEASFDLIVSNGVLHHTPDTKRAFLLLAKHVKPGGKLYIWLYRKPFRLKNKLFLWVSDCLRRVISRAPKALQKPLVEGLTGFFYTFSRFRKGRNSSKSYNELLIDVYDSYTPKHRHYHNPIEVAGWFHEASFSAPVLSHWDNSFGFGMYAVKKGEQQRPAGENFNTVNFNPAIHRS
jgi:SAM-dependent methyltransferase